MACSNGVDLRWKHLPASAAYIRVCLNGECKLSQLSADQIKEFKFADIDFEGDAVQRGDSAPSSVIVKVLDGGKHVILRRHVTMKLEKVYPNGPDCPGWCFVAYVKFVGPNYKLVPAPR